MKKTVQQKIDEAFAEMTAIVQNTSFITDRTRILRLPFTLFKKWESGMAAVANEVLQYNGIKYFTIKKPNAQQSLIAPSDPSAIDLYRAFTDSDDKDYILGEYVENGWVRYDDGIAYEAYGITDPINIFKNLVKPSEAPANWILLTT